MSDFAGNIDLDWLKAELKKPGKSQKGLADALGISAPQVSRILSNQREIKARELSIIRQYVGGALKTTTARGPAQEAAVADIPVSSTRDLPVLGAALGGAYGVGTFMDNGQFFELVGRPPQLIGVKDAYAAYMVGESMEPRYFSGELLAMHPHKPIRPGDFVLAQLHRQSGEREYLVKRFDKRTTDHVILHQFNPAKDIKVPVAELVAMHRIVSNGVMD